MPVGRIVGLDATTHLHHGLLADHPVSARQSRLASERQAGLTVDFVAVLDDGTPVVDLQLPDVEVRISGRVIRTLRKVAR